MGRITRVPYKSRQYVVYPILLGAVDISNTTVAVSIRPVLDWDDDKTLLWQTGSFTYDETNPGVQVMVGIDTQYELEPGLYRVNWRIDGEDESTIVVGDRYLEIYTP